MTWAIERDNAGRPVRMWWSPVNKRELFSKPAKPVPGCLGCGFHFGWHTLGCKRNSDNATGEQP